MTEIKFTQQELENITNIQTQYQTIGVQMVQCSLAIENTKKYLQQLEQQQIELTQAAMQISESEKQLSLELENKYGKGEINMQTGIFTPFT